MKKFFILVLIVISVIAAVLPFNENTGTTFLGIITYFTGSFATITGIVWLSSDFDRLSDGAMKALTCGSTVVSVSLLALGYWAPVTLTVAMISIMYTPLVLLGLVD